MDEKLAAFIARNDERWERIEEDLAKLKHVLLEGNGTPAMTVRMAVAEKELERLKEERDDKKMPRAAWVGIIVSILLGLVGFASAMV